MYFAISISIFYILFSWYTWEAEIKTSEKVILEKATFVVNGKTNVNTFDCQLHLKELSDTFSIQSHMEGIKLHLEDLELKFRVEDFDCGMAMMTKDFRSLLKADEHPYIFLNITEIEFKQNIQGDTLYAVNALVELNIGGNSKDEFITEGYFGSGNSTVELTGTKAITMTSYGITPPKKFLGTVKVSDDLIIDFELYWKLSGNP